MLFSAINDPVQSLALQCHILWPIGVYITLRNYRGAHFMRCVMSVCVSGHVT